MRLAQGDVDGARAEALRSLTLDRTTGHPPSIAADHLLLAEIETQKGNSQVAMQHRRRAERIHELMGLAPGTQENRR